MRTLALAAALALALAAPLAAASHPNPVSACFLACATAATAAQGTGTCQAGAPYRQETTYVVATAPGGYFVNVHAQCFAHSYLGSPTRGAALVARAGAPQGAVHAEWSGYAGAAAACTTHATVDSSSDVSTGNLGCPAGPPPAAPPVLLLLP